MSTYQTVPTQYTTVDGNKVGYRRLGKTGGIPLLYLNHLRGSMDTIDPLFINSIAKTREIIVYDSFGIGHSEGIVPISIEGMAEVAVKFLQAISVSIVDLIGFSMGGGIAQYIGWIYPDLVRKLVLAGTQSSIGDGVELPQKDVLEAGGDNDVEPTKEEMFFLFYYPSETSRALAEAWWKRIHERQFPEETRTGYLVGPGVRNQLTAIFTFTVTESNFDRLKDIKAPTLVTNGHSDVMSATVNSFVLQQSIPNAQLILYPDSGHGHLFQEPVLFAQHLDNFLGGTQTVTL